MNAPITAVYAALLSTLFIVLAFRVVRLRWSERVALGHGSSKILKRAVRVHGNAAEYVPFILLLLLLLEINGGAAWLVHAFGAAAFIGRVIHALWLSRFTGASFGRTTGTALTWFAILGLSGANLWLFFKSSIG